MKLIQTIHNLYNYTKKNKHKWKQIPNTEIGCYIFFLNGK